MKQAKKIITILSVFSIVFMFSVQLAGALEADYSVFIFAPGQPIKSDMMSFTGDGALIFDTSYGSGSFIDLGGTFAAYFITSDLFSAPAILTMTGIIVNPLILATGIANIGGKFSVFTVAGRLLYNYDSEE